MITRREFTKLSMSVVALMASGKPVLAGTGIDKNAEGIDPRRVGRRALGAYWGSYGERIDLMSGNLSFATTVANPSSRLLKTALHFSYNSQVFQNTSSALKTFAVDSGYGFGWRLQFAAIIPDLASDGSVRGYRLVDSFGSEYSLTASNGVWVSLDSAYKTWNPSNSTLYYKDGTTMKFGSVSASREPDAGRLYPTSIECSNGNTIEVQYLPGLGETGINTSSRIASIADAESVYAPSGAPTYSFIYSGDGLPHLSSIVCNTIAGNSYSFTYSKQTITDPFLGKPLPDESTSMLASVVQATGVGKSFQYNQHGELVSVTLEKGAVLTWEYQTFAFSSGVQVREVGYRSLYPSGLSTTPQIHAFNRDPSDSSLNIHSSLLLSDGAGNAKKWSFASNSADPNIGLAVGSDTYHESSLIHQIHNEWSRTPQGAPYVSNRTVTYDPGTQGSVVHRTETDQDEFGNVIETRLYDSGSPTAAPRVVKHSYLRNSTYLSKHILNRKLRTTIVQGPKSRTQYESIYDSTPLVDHEQLSHHNSSTHGATNVVRGNATERIVNGVYSRYTSDITGLLVLCEDSTGSSYAFTYDPLSNNTRVNSVTPNNNKAMEVTHQYAPDTGLLIRADGPNGATGSITYDSLGRVRSAVDPSGLRTDISHEDLANSSSTTITLSSGGWTRNVYDGVGRVVKREHGDTTGLSSQEEFTYGFIIGHPGGKLMNSSLRHSPGAAPVWKTRAFDTLGRIVSQTDPKGIGTQTISYAGTSQTVTDGVGRWKKIVHDACGRVVKVVVPDTHGGSDKVTVYSYDVVGNLNRVSMPRSTGTQLRHFKYDENNHLSARQHAESGLQTFICNPDGTLASKIDAKQQKEVFLRDKLRRATARMHYDANGALLENASALYFYDTNPIDSTFSQNGIGRLVAVQYGSKDTDPGLISEQYSYTPSGALTRKRVTLQRGNHTALLESACSYDGEGRLIELSYPSGGPKLSYAYDAGGRLAGISTVDAEIVRNVKYNPNAGLAGFDILAASKGQYLTEQHEYDAQNRLTRIVAGPSDSANANGTIPALDLAWGYNKGDGRVSHEDDNISGVTVGYRYDKNGRLEVAESSDKSWGLSYQYDGFGNRTQQAVRLGQAYGNEATFDPATNWILSSDTAYDANGNVVSLPYLSLEYDSRNRLKTAKNQLTGIQQYGYDQNDQRIWMKTAAQECFFFYCNNQRLATYTVVSAVDGSFSFRLKDTRTYFAGRVVRAQNGALVTDRLGAVRGWSDKEGSKTTKYFPFGEQLGKVDATRSGFGGYDRDESGLDYAWHRYYSSRMGRFATPDPCERSVRKTSPDSWNRYTFVNNDPINRVDPNGLYDDTPTVPYTTLAGAIQASAASSIQTSDVTGVEHAEAILRNPDGSYSLTAGTQTDTALSFNIQYTIAPGQTAVGLMHDHVTDISEPDTFSSQDIAQSAASGLPYYMVDGTTGNVFELQATGGQTVMQNGVSYTPPIVYTVTQLGNIMTMPVGTTTH